MIKVIFSRMLEAAINPILALSQNSNITLKKHHGKVLKLIITELNQEVYLIFRNERIYVQSFFDDKPDTIIQGKLLTLVKQIIPQEEMSNLTIEGDVDFAHDVQLLLQNMDIDWQEYLSYFTGDFVANRVSSLLQELKQSTIKTTTRSIDDIVDYIQEEKRFLPTSEEVEDFYEDIATLRQSLDRLEARWNRLKEK